MKVVLRSSSLAFFFGSVLLGLPIRRRVLGNSGVGGDGAGRMVENVLADGSGERFGWRVLAAQQKKSAAEPVAE